MNDKWVKRWVVPSSSSDKDYIIAMDADGNYACSCIGWTRHVPRKDCRHITEVKEGRHPTEAEAIMRRLTR